MDLLERFLADMRTKMRSGGASCNVAHHIMQFHDMTGNAFNVNFNIIKPAPVPSESRGRYAQLNGCLDARLIISQRREYQGQRTRFHRVMAGVVVKFPEWKVLSIMPEQPNSDVDMKYVAENWDDYVVFPTRDGTTATLYWDAGSDASAVAAAGIAAACAATNAATGAWRVSTYNGHDVSDHKWLGETTFMQAIDELCRKHEKFSWDRLQKTRAYTVLFHHPDFHPFNAEPAGIELVQCVDTSNISRGIIMNADIGIPNLPTCDITLDQITAKRDSSISDFRKNPENRCYGYTLRHRSTLVNPSIMTAVSMSSTRGAAAAAAAEPVRGSRGGRGRGNYEPRGGRGGARGRGRGAAGDTHASVSAGAADASASAAGATTPTAPQWLGLSHDMKACDYIIESRLMLFIRRTVYDLPRGANAPVQLNTPAERIDYYCVRAMLGKPDICTIFMALFPQYKARYDDCNALIRTLRDRLVAAIGCNGGDTATGRPKGFDSISTIAASLYDGLVQHKLNMNSSQTASIIDDYIRNPDNLLMFHAYYQSTR